MGSFFDEYWDALWTGWTPIISVGFFLVGIKLGGWISGYFNTFAIRLFSRFLIPFIFGLSVPLFSIMSKNKRR